MTDKQKLARIRNWNKRRVSAIQVNVNQLSGGEYISPTRGLTEEETIKLKLVNKELNKLLLTWDKNGEKLGLFSRKLKRKVNK